jgi:hypothetical protein
VRVPLTVPVRTGTWLDLEGPRRISSGSLVDISVGGVQIRALNKITPGATVELEFALEPRGSSIRTQGMVVGTSRGPAGVANHAHIAFIEYGTDGRRRIEEFIERAESVRPAASDEAPSV